MAFNVTLKQSGRQFQVESDETVLAAALRQNVHLPYGCKNGACGSCKGQIVSGQIEQGPHAASALSSDERTRGLALLCCSKAQCDLEIDVREIAGVDGVQVKKLPCRVAALERRGDDVMIVKLQLPANERLQYLAGQYVEFILKDGSRRSYSMANAPHDDTHLQLHVRRTPGGAFSKYVFEEMKERAILRFEGPLGSFYLREVARPLLFLAGGTGLAPFLSMLEVLARSGSQQKVHLVYGVTRDLDLVCVEALDAYAARLPNFTFATVVADAASNHARTGWVTQHIPADALNDGDVDVYLCGPPPMVDAVRGYFDEQRVTPRSFHYEKFTPNVTAKAA